MPHKFWFIIATTPWWMYLIFLSLIHMSLLLTKPRIIELKPYYLSFFSLLFFMSVTCYVLPPNEKALIFTLPLLLAGTIIGRIAISLRGVKAIEHQKKLLLPGSWLMFMIILALFITRQWIYFSVANFDLIMWFHHYGPTFLLPLYGFSIGLNFTQLMYFKRIIHNGPYTTENELNMGTI